MAREEGDPKKRISFAMMAIGYYNSAITGMADYKASLAAPDPAVDAQLKKARSEMACLQIQMGLTSD